MPDSSNDRNGGGTGIDTAAALSRAPPGARIFAFDATTAHRGASKRRFVTAGRTGPAEQRTAGAPRVEKGRYGSGEPTIGGGPTGGAGGAGEEIGTGEGEGLGFVSLRLGFFGPIVCDGDGEGEVDGDGDGDGFGVLTAVVRTGVGRGELVLAHTRTAIAATSSRFPAAFGGVRSWREPATMAPSPTTAIAMATITAIWCTDPVPYAVTMK